MTVSIDSTTKKYHGRKAETYDEIRKKQERWDIENAVVQAELAELRPIASVLDVPVGTGRFLRVYDRFGVEKVYGVDVSDEMLLLAAKKARKCENREGIVLKRKDVRDLGPVEVDVTVCVRFLDLIDESAMLTVMKRLIEYTQKAIICTIRFGPTYIPKSNTATHDRAKFRAMLKERGWKIAKAIPVFKQGWYILLLTPR